GGSSQGQDGNGKGIYAQRYGADGATRGGEFLVNTETSGDEENPAVASDRDGNFLVVWSLGTFIPQGAAQLFSSSGAPVGSEIPLAGAYPHVAWDGVGGYVVVSQAGLPSRRIFAQQLSSAGGVPVGEAVQANSYTPYDQNYPVVAADGSGGFIAVWQTIEEGASDLDIFARRFDASGSPVGNEFRVNTYTTGQQSFPV